MKKLSCLSLMVGALTIGSGSRAQPEPNMPATGPGGTTSSAGQSSFELGLRVGYGIPLGTAAGTGADTMKQSDVIKGMIPFWLDVGYKFDPNWYLGGFFQFGLGFVPSNSVCSLSGVSCSSNDLRFGLNVHYHFLPAESFDPWVGIGAGYEILNQSASGTVLGVPFSGSSSSSGFEFGNAQIGVDLKASPQFGVGPFVAFTVGQYSSGSTGITVGGTTLSDSGIQDKRIHEWLMFGVRGVFDIGMD